MLFVFQVDSNGGFWMKNTLIPLDIAFFAVDGTFVDSMTMAPCTEDPCPTYRQSGSYRYAVEAPAYLFDRGSTGDGVECGRHCRRPLVEQLGGRPRRVQGRHRDDPFVGQAEALSRCRQYPDVLAPLDDRLSEFGGAIDDVFAVVQHQQYLLG